MNASIDRRDRILLTIALVLASLVGRIADARGGEPQAVAVGCVGVTVADLAGSLAFYEGLLDARKEAEFASAGPRLDRLTGVPSARVRVARLRLGEECLELVEWEAKNGRAIPADSRSNDGWFQHVAIVVADMDRAYRKVHSAGVEHVSPAPERIPDSNPAAGGIRAFYFRDPDRHVLELIWYPDGKGDPRWQRASGRLFLGIDHTAIAVQDTEASLRFWRDALGLRVTGESLNHGPEQERLSGVPGARVRITGLRARGGPGVEFLEYLAPRDGRPYPPDARPNDLVHWQTSVWVEDVSVALAAARSAGGTAITPQPVDPPAGRGAVRSALARDPDGHAVELVQP